VTTKLLLKSGFWYTATSFLTRAMVFITMPIFTRILTKEQYGDFNVFANWQATLLIICGLEVYSTINRARFDFDGEGELDGYITSALTLSATFTGVLFILFLALPHLFDRLLLLDRRYILIMFLYLMTYPSFATFQAKQRIEYRYKLSAGLAFVLLALSYLLSLSLTLSMKSDRLFGRIFGQYILYIAAGIFFYCSFFYRSHHITLKALKYVLRIGLPLVFAYLGSQLLLSSDSIVVKHMCSGEQVSYLAITHSCSHVVLILVQAMNTAWAPWFYDMLKINNMKSIQKMYQIYLWGVVLGTFAVILIGPEIILILGGKQYLESLYILPVYILCGVFTVLTSQFSSLETYHKKPEYAAIFTATAAVLNVILDIVGVKLWGYRAVCYATLLCQLVLIALHYLFTLKLGVREILPVNRLLIALGFSLLLIPIALFLYQSNLIRYLCIGLLSLMAAAFAVLKKNEIIDIFRRLRKSS